MQAMGVGRHASVERRWNVRFHAWNGRYLRTNTRALLLRPAELAHDFLWRTIRCLPERGQRRDKGDVICLQWAQGERQLGRVRGPKRTL